ncbi:hypothetical protein [Pedobacter sp. Bi36]|uniref:hypothetical protein n=1 Tax=Pedobacter sp. Bi36 TaxID=2822352 RepID=UPI001E37DF6A|nr:hypothetical protein [Pedobacter sp. Bi36]
MKNDRIVAKSGKDLGVEMVLKTIVSYMYLIIALQLKSIMKKGVLFGNSDYKTSPDIE